jgi:ankyrin repeat protein
VRESKVGAVEALLEHGADVNAVNDRGIAPLDIVGPAQPDEDEIAKLLISKGAKRRSRP